MVLTSEGLGPPGSLESGGMGLGGGEDMLKDTGAYGGGMGWEQSEGGLGAE